MKIVASTPDPKIVVIEDLAGGPWPIEHARYLAYEVLNEARSRQSQGRYGYRGEERWTVEQTENPAWDYTRPDCFAIADDGSEHPMETLKQIKAFCKTGIIEESARQKKTRQREAVWAQWKTEHNFNESIEETA